MIQRHEEPEYWSWDYDCPHCGTEYMAPHCHETDSGLQECEVCENEFEIEIEYNPTYSTSKVEG